MLYCRSSSPTISETLSNIHFTRQISSSFSWCWYNVQHWSTITAWISLYGRHLQGRQKKAIEAYTTGMNTASSNHRSYSALAKSKEAATLQQAKRVDFITQLPLEVVSQFIVPVILKYQPSSMYKQWQYLGVSHAWRYRLLQPSPLHYEVQEPYQARVAHVNELDKYKDYVRSVTVYRFRGGDDSAQAFPWQDSKSLRRLQLFG